jgi:CheY-like chemotaxis protein
LQPVALANILNGKTNNTEYHEGKNPELRFIVPDVRALIVDDIEINLDVAEGLLSPYQMVIDRASGGAEAVRMAQENRYDFVLMDHMMPGMDGIEATAAIRAWEDKSAQGLPKERLPIIALTANAISGMKEMFLEKGFSDYLSKPIEIAKLDEIMARWIPVEKRIKTSRGIRRPTFAGESVLSIPGVDVKRGVNMTGGTEAGYRKVLAQFCKDAAERLPLFAAPPTETAVNDFATQAHAIKGAAGTIGATELSEEAAVLEAAGKAGDTRTIEEALPLFHERLVRLIEDIGKVLEEEKIGKQEGRREKGGTKHQELRDNFFVIREKLEMLQIMLEVKNMKEIDKLLTEIETAATDTKTAEMVMDVSDKILMGEYHDAIKDINHILIQIALDN